MPPDPTSNGIAVPFDDRYFAPLRDSSAFLGDAGELRSRYRQDGYLYLRGVLDRPTVMTMRQAYFSAFPAGYLRGGTPAVEGVFSGQRPLYRLCA